MTVIKKAELVGQLAEALETTKKEATAIYETVSQVIADVLADGQDVKIENVGTLTVATQAAREEREGRNPKTGEALTIAAQPAQTTIRFKVSKSFKEALNA